MIPSKYQQAIYDFIPTSEQSLNVNAVAGSGKTTTIRKALPLFKGNVLLCAFNAEIAKVLGGDAPANVTVKTLNAFGWHICLEHMFGIQSRVQKFKTANTLERFVSKTKERARFFGYLNPTQRLVSLFKANCLFTRPTDQQIQTMMDYHGLDMPKGGDQSFYDTVGNVYEACLRNQNEADFDDQVFFPVYLNLPMPKYSVSIVDESQDLNAIQIEMLLRTSGRIASVGDPKQSIYAFRGADADAMAKLIKLTNAKELPLSICYRCAKNIVKEAQRLVPYIEASDTAVDGIVAQISKEKYRNIVAERDFVGCRTTAPLVSECLYMIREGRRAIVKGKEIGEALSGLIDKINVERTEDLSRFHAQLRDYRVKEFERLDRTDNETAKEILADRLDTIAVLVESVDSVQAMHDRIVQIFSNLTPDNAIIYSTLHKLKGLEARRVFIIRRDLLPHPSAKQPHQMNQERNLEYIGITRAREELYWVQ